MNLQWTLQWEGVSNQDNELDGISQSNVLSRLRLALKSITNSLQILPFLTLLF